MIQRFTNLAVAGVMILAAGCNGGGSNNVVDKVTFKYLPESNTAQVKMIFANTVQPVMAGQFFIENGYGTIFMTPFTQTQPFELGYEFNMNVLTDPLIGSMEKTDSLPNGINLGIGYPVVQIAPKDSSTDKFNMYGYVDVTNLKWMGASAMFKFMNDKNFPAGMAITNIFKLDNNKKPAIVAHVFGALLDNDGTLIRNGGIAVLANVRYLIDSNSGRAPGEEIVYTPIKK